MKARAFVTGGTGFVGANLVRELLSDGCEVRVLVRQGADHRNVEGLPVETVDGDLERIETIEPALTGCDVVFHVAALYSLWRRDREQIYRVNVDATRNLLKAARTVGVPRVVLTSSVSAIGVPPLGTSATEATETTVEALVGDYKKSKFLGEQEAITAARQGQDVVIVNPSTPIGAFDIKPTPTGEIIVRFLKRQMPFYVNTGLNLIDVRDVARGHIQAWKKGRSGERYILGHRNLTLLEMLQMLERITGLPAPRWPLPHAIPLVAAYTDEMLLGRLPGWNPSLSYTSVQMSQKVMFYDAARAVSELGLPQNPIEPALAAAVEWFRKTRIAG